MRTVVSQTIDEGTTTASGVAAVRTALSSRSYDVLVGIANSDVLAAVADDVTTARIPLLGTNGSPADMPTSAFIWRTSFVAGEASRALGQLPARRRRPGRAEDSSSARPARVVVYHDSSSDAIAEAKAFTDTLGAIRESRCHVVTTQNLSSAHEPDPSWHADLVYAAVAAPSAAAFISAYVQAGIDSRALRARFVDRARASSRRVRAASSRR